jgi:hypothetical protein
LGQADTTRFSALLGAEAARFGDKAVEKKVEVERWGKMGCLTEGSYRKLYVLLFIFLTGHLITK